MSYSAIKDLEGYFTPTQVRVIINSADTPRNKMLMLMLWRTGRRISEVLPLKKKHIDFYKGLIKFRILKKREKTYKLKPVDSEFINELNDYCKDLQDEDYLFSSNTEKDAHIKRRQAYDIINKTAVRAGITSVGDKQPHPHHFRHSYAVHFIRSCQGPAGLKMLQELLEHSNINITGSYLQFSGEDLKKELNKIKWQ